MSKYQKLRNEISKIEGSKGIAKFYSGALFADTSWYTATLDEPEIEEGSAPVALSTTVEEELPPQRPSAEGSPSKAEVLSSLAKKIDEKGAVQSRFGNITKDEKAISLGSKLILTKDQSEYKKLIESNLSSFEFEKFEGVSALIVGESRNVDLNSEQAHYKFSHDNTELLGKMIIPMKLEEGEFLRASLLGDTDEEVLQNLLCEIALFKPKAVISLGAVATNFLYGKKEKLSKIHGQELERIIEIGDESINFTLFPIFHPDLLEINPSMKRTAWMDLQKVMKFLGKI
ncbi:hypothetical protein BIY24_02740 [Halobacteriovorax marinus]|uniref:uracil-DNA glycosylase family protein n=1 Tax=Halobacteriovorax marinus TaxID=97084 RepID=UPI000BC2FE70|nr:uracil-DNA glycosylase family protein [Halobacteriovorax marinus]ATH06890.1 hypothetical protein BIY24_02740 [Halobacteriovorax marinus]